MILDTYQPVLLFSAVVGFSIGIMLFIIGRFGRRTDDHPLCRRCGFDLVGSIDRSAHCPECGREVSPTRGVIIGHRKPYRSYVIISIIFLTFSITAFTAEIIPIVRSVKWIRIKPTAWLITDINGNQPAQQGAATNELARRIGNRRLDQDTTRELITSALGIQADRTSPWIVGWGNILDEAIAADELTAEERTIYLKNAIAPILTVKYDTAENDRTFFLLGFTTGSLRIGSSARFALSGRILRVFIDDKELPITNPPDSDEVAGQEARISIFGMSTAALLLEKRHLSLNKGMHSVKAVMRFALVSIADPEANPFAVNTIELRGSVAVSSLSPQILRDR